MWTPSLNPQGKTEAGPETLSQTLAGTQGLTFDPSLFLPSGSGQSPSPSHQSLEALSCHCSRADVTEENLSASEKNNV